MNGTLVSHIRSNLKRTLRMLIFNTDNIKGEMMMRNRIFKMWIFVITLSISLCLAASEKNDLWGSLQPGPYSVGFRYFTVADDTRVSVVVNSVSGSIERKYVPRDIKIYLWYPAKSDGTASGESLKLYIECLKTDFARSSENEKIEPMVLMNFPLGKGADKAYLKKILESPVLARKDAEPAVGKYPVIIVGQGYNYKSPFTHFFLCEYLASRGFVVATSPLAGLHSPAANLTPEDLETQIRDMEFVASIAMRQPFAEQGRIGALGFDLGGLSAAMLVMRNPMISVLVSLDSGLIFRHNLDLMEKTTGFNPGRISVPLLHFISPAAETKAMGIKEDYSLWEAASCEKMFLVRIPGMPHGHFTSYALFEDKQPVAGYWGAPIPGAADKYRALCRAIADFLDANLKNDSKKSDFSEKKIKEIFGRTPVSVETRLNKPQQFTSDDFLNLILSDKSEAACKMAAETWKSSPSAEFLQEGFLNQLGYRLLYFSGTPAAALDIFNLNAEIHPASSNAFDSLGEAYLTLGNNDLAVINYKKSLELDPKNDNARRMLEQIEKNK
jgi:dienelactone hydrolase